jgi:hypothetical protein
MVFANFCNTNNYKVIYFCRPNIRPNVIPNIKGNIFQLTRQLDLVERQKTDNQNQRTTSFLLWVWHLALKVVLMLGITLGLMLGLANLPVLSNALCIVVSED